MKGIHCLATLAVSCFAGLPPATAAEEIPAKIVVRYTDLDLSRPKDALKLYHRMRRAAQAVCDSYPTLELHQLEIRDECVDRALKKAVMELQSQEVTAIYRSESARRGKP